jgi:hypothetical protein
MSRPFLALTLAISVGLSAVQSIYSPSARAMGKHALQGKTGDPAAPLAILMTAMPPPKKSLGIYDSYFKMQPFNIEKDFRKFFAAKLPGFRLEVVHEPDARRAWEILKSPGNTAVFWVSHAGGFGSAFADLLTDFDGNNLAPVFQWLHPDTRLLAIAGCKSNPILKNMVDRDWIIGGEQLETWGTDDVVQARLAFRAALAKELPRLRELEKSASPRRAACPTRRGVELTITRRISPNVSGKSLAPAVQVSVANRLVSVFPSAVPGSETTLQAWVELPSTEIRASKLNVAVDTNGGDEMDPKRLGDFEIRADAIPGAAWDVVKIPGTDKPMGVHMHLFNYKGPLKLPHSLSDFEPWSCL